jgi:hypothetical protein
VEEHRSEKRQKKSSLSGEDRPTGQKNTLFSFVKPGLSNTQGGPIAAPATGEQIVHAGIVEVL